MALETIYDPQGRPKLVSDSDLGFYLDSGYSLTPPADTPPPITIGGGSVEIVPGNTDVSIGGGTVSTDNDQSDQKIESGQGFTDLLPDKTGPVDAEDGSGGGSWLHNLLDQLAAGYTTVFQNGAQDRSLEGVVGAGSRGGGRGGGGGGSGRLFAPRDRRDYEESARMYLISLVGKATDARIKWMADRAMTVDRHNFDNPTQPISLDAEWRDYVRATDDYQQIHELRPDNIEDTEWISSQAGALVRAGLAPNLVDDRAIVLATAGAADPTTNARFNAIQTSASAPGFLNQFRQTAQVVTGMIK